MWVPRANMELLVSRHDSHRDMAIMLAHNISIRMNATSVIAILLGLVLTFVYFFKSCREGLLFFRFMMFNYRLDALNFTRPTYLEDIE